MTAIASTRHRARVRNTVRERAVTSWLFVAVSVVALACFAWPLVAVASPGQAEAWAPLVACLLIPVLAVGATLLVEHGVTARPDAAKFVALLGLLAAAGSVVRLFAGAGGGIEAVFVILILGGAAFGPRFGFLLGTVTIGVSSLAWGLIGPWLPFQMFAAAWVGAGAGLVSDLVRRAARRRSTRIQRWIEMGALIAYGLLASYAYGALLNLWFWPFAVGSDTSISYVPGGDMLTNLTHFGVYTLVTSTATWDTVRAIVTVVGISALGPGILAGLRRAKLERG